jgi:hypothetical protein
LCTKSTVFKGSFFKRIDHDDLKNHSRPLCVLSLTSAGRRSNPLPLMSPQINLRAMTATVLFLLVIYLLIFQGFSLFSYQCSRPPFTRSAWLCYHKPLCLSTTFLIYF